MVSCSFPTITVTTLAHNHRRNIYLRSEEKTRRVRAANCRDEVGTTTLTKPIPVGEGNRRVPICSKLSYIPCSVLLSRRLRVTDGNAASFDNPHATVEARHVLRLRQKSRATDRCIRELFNPRRRESAGFTADMWIFSTNTSPLDPIATLALLL